MLKPGDRVNCHLKESQVVSPFDLDFDDEKTFEIIAINTCDNGYYLFVPSYLHVRHTFILDRYNIREANIDPKFIGEECLYILEKLIYKVYNILDGMACSKCKVFYDYADANQADGTLICWSCRTYPPYD